MSDYQVVFNETTKVATIQDDGAVVPEGSVLYGTFSHNGGDSLGDPINHVLYHHVRDILYPYKEWNMQSITIVDASTIAPTSVTLAPAEVSIGVSETTQLKARVFPLNATVRTVTYESDTPTIATVSSTGLVTGVSVGEATITVTTDEGDFTAECAVTVTA